MDIPCRDSAHRRPIRLADVLLAIGHHFRHDREDIRISDSGYFDENRNGDILPGWEMTAMSWNLLADDLESQSEGTINF